jgi:F0F1-type ATP synthase assembly protein I
MSQAPGPEEEKSGKARPPGFGQITRDIAPYLTLGMQLAAAVILFFLIGWWVDTRLETEPLFMLIGVGLGFLGGMIKFLKSVTELSKKN